MAFEIRLPNLGQTSDEMTIVEWYKAEGEPVELAEPMLCVETDKSQVDVESAEEGILLKIVAQPGERLESGALLAYVGAEGEEPLSADSTADVSPAAPDDLPPKHPAQANGPEPDAAQAAAGIAGMERVRVKASPAVRKLAADLGVDLAQVAGSGPGGLIERSDVERARDQLADGVTQPAGDSHDVPPVRRAIARRLTRSIQTIPQFSIIAHLDARAAQREVTEHRANGTAKLTYTHLLLRVVARGLRAHPMMQRLWLDEGPRYRMLSEPDVGLAVAGDDSLHVVTIPAPDSTPLPALVETVTSAAGRARAGTIQKHDQRPAAISVSNLGMYDVDSFRAIVDPDQTAILAAASVQDRVVAANGAFAVVPQLTVCLSCDHRTVDGVEAARFLRTVRTFFETDPAGR